MSEETTAWHPSQRWPRIKDLPAEEQAPFVGWLAGKTRPLILNADGSTESGYYGWDYYAWQAEQHHNLTKLKEFLHHQNQ